MRIKNNSGSTLIMVIIIIGFISILSSILLTMTGNAVRMKNTNKASKSNFYSAETVLSEIRIGLEGVVSDALKGAYVEVLTNYLDDRVDKKEVFANKFTENIVDKLKDGTDSKKYSRDIIKGYIVTAPAGTISLITSGIENELKIDNTSPDKPYVILKNIKISYTDSKNYKTTLSTDIKIDVPEVVFNSTTSGYNAFSDYGLIADKDIITEGGTADIEGSVYAGENIKLNSLSNLSINKAKNIIALENIEVIDASKLEIEGKANIWAKNIATSIINNSGTSEDTTININGNCYISNDLLLNARKSNVKIEGEYYGYGNGDKASNSSAIIINGLKSELDISGLSKLLIAGRAYIDPRTADNTVRDELNIKTGESLAVRGNQYAYLIPSEYLWEYDPSVGGTGGDPGGEPENKIYFENSKSNWSEVWVYFFSRDENRVPKDITVGKPWPGVKIEDSAGGIFTLPYSSSDPNLMMVFNNGAGSKTEDLKYINNGYYDVNGPVDPPAGGGSPVANPTKPVTNPVPEAIYKARDEGTDRLGDIPMVNLSKELKKYCVEGNEYTKVFYKNGTNNEVFFFFNFKDDASANEYLKKYFKDEKGKYDSRLEDTIKGFANSIIINNDNPSSIISPANLITYEDSRGVNLKENSVLPGPDSVKIFVDNITAKQDLVIRDLYGISSTEDITGKTAYTSIVNSLLVNGEDTVVVDGYKGYVKRGDVRTSGGEKGIIIASGNVEVNGTFKGLIISGGSIKLNSGAEVIASSHIVDTILNAKTPFNNYFKNVVVYNNTSGGAPATSDQVNISNLIRYEKWKRNDD